jgi:3-dehydroquinate dehydratase-2
VSRTVFVLNGPNLDLLGKRQPEIYGRETLRQSNREYELIDWIHEARDNAAAIVINPAGYSHTSVAILDALAAFAGPIIEVHISNIHKREPFRRHSYVSTVAAGVIAGCGTQGYALALQRVASLLEEAKAP